MSRVLDLSVYRQETLDITMPDGAIVHICKPTQAMLIKMLNMRDVDENAPSERIAGAIDGFVLAVLNSNIDGRTFAQKDADALTLEMKTAIIDAYSAFAYELQSNPTSASRTSPASGTGAKTTGKNLRGRFARWWSTRG